MERFDVAVVGGGPAGASAARAAATAGAEVVVVEKGVPRADRAEPGPDSTDAAGMLDYWLDLMDLDPADLPEGVVLQELDRAEFFGPTETLELRSTGIEAENYDGFGFTFQRARFDDWLRERAEAAGAAYRVGASVQSVESRVHHGSTEHALTVSDGADVEAEYLVLADGPQRRLTIPALDQFLPDGTAARRLSPPAVNHIAYQEHRRFPADAFDPASIKFWWGWMPGETAYPWVFPNDDRVARVGLTMPIGMDVDDFDRSAYRLLDGSDDQIPQGDVYVERLLAEVYGDRYDLDDFPLVGDRGKRDGTETYPISSTRPVDSPTHAGIAVAGGAMGATSAFHEGGDHVAVATGSLAGRLAAEGALHEYNDAWKAAVGGEMLRNVAMAECVADFEPGDWDRTFRVARRLRDAGGMTFSPAAGLAGLSLVGQYRWKKRCLRAGGYVQIRESEYAH